MFAICMIALSGIVACNQSINMLLFLSKAAWLLIYIWDHCSSCCHGFGDSCATVKKGFAVSVVENIASISLIFQVTDMLQIFLLVQT